MKSSSTKKNKVRPQSQATTASAPVTAASMDDIFSKLKKTTKAASSGDDVMPKKTPSDAKRQPQESATPASDGLFRDKSKTVEMGDDAFFGEALCEKLRDGVDLTTKRKRPRKDTTGQSVSTSRKELRGFDRVVTEDEIAKMTSSNPNAGTTPNCPFDCDCCF